MFRRRRSPAREDDCNTETKRARLSKAPMHWQQREVFTRGDHVVDRQKQWESVGAWFLGPKAENGEVFRDLYEGSELQHSRGCSLGRIFL